MTNAQLRHCIDQSNARLRDALQSMDYSHRTMISAQVLTIAMSNEKMRLASDEMLNMIGTLASLGLAEVCAQVEAEA